MKRLLFIAIFLLIPITAWSAPFLVCDTYTTNLPTYFNVTMDGGSPVQSLPQSFEGGVRLHYDLASLSNGSHSAVVSACNDFGCSANSSPFAFVKTVPSAPANIRLFNQ